MITYQEETWEEFKSDALPLMLNHNVEINLFNEPLDIDADTYEDLYESGYLKIYTIRAGTRLVGYCAFMLFFHSHHATVLNAKQDVLYIEPNYRGRCLTFISFCDAELKKSGVKFIHQCVPDQNDFSGLLMRLGYTKLETIYLRSL